MAGGGVGRRRVPRQRTNRFAARRRGVGPGLRDGEPAEASVRRLLDRWNSAPDRLRLLVLDNVVDPDELTGLVPQLGAATVVLTSARATRVFGPPVGVDVYTPDAAIAYLDARTGLADAAGAAVVAKELGYLPLALAQAGSTITGRRLTYASYLEALAELPMQDTLVREPGEEYPRSAGAALLLSLQTALDTSSHPSLLRAALDTLSLLSPGGVRRTWLEALGAPFDVAGAVAGLVDAALVTFSDDATSLIMHRLVARVARERSTGLDLVQEAHKTVLAVLGAVDPLGAESYWVRRDEAAEFATQLQWVLTSEPGTGLAEHPSVVTAAIRASFALNELGDPYAAIAIGGSALALAARVLGADHPDTLTSRNNLAYAYGSAGDLGRAIPLYKQTLTDRERVLGADHPDTLTSRNNLALAQWKAGNRSDALQIMGIAADLATQRLGTSHLLTQDLLARYDAMRDRQP